MESYLLYISIMVEKEKQFLQQQQITNILISWFKFTGNKIPTREFRWIDLWKLANTIPKKVRYQSDWHKQNANPLRQPLSKDYFSIIFKWSPLNWRRLAKRFKRVVLKDGVGTMPWECNFAENPFETPPSVQKSRRWLHRLSHYASWGTTRRSR